MKIKKRIILSSFSTIIVSMVLILSVFYFFAYSDARAERTMIFKEKSVDLAQNFYNMLDYYETIVKKYAPSKEFVFLLNDNFFVRNLSVDSSKKLIKQIKNSEKSIKNIYIFNKNNSEVFSKKISIDIKKLVKNKVIIKKGSLFVYSFIDDKKGILVFEILLEFLEKKLDNDLFQYYIMDKEGKVILSSSGYQPNLYIKFMKDNKLLEKKDLMYYFTSFDEYMVVTIVEKDVLFKRVDKVFFMIILWILAISLLSMFQSIKTSSMITNPIDKLTKVLGKNRNGEYSKIDLKGDEEVEYFAAQYNDMIDRITEFTKDLEEKVKARTKDIELQKKELKILSQTDTLTGLYNRNKLNDLVIQRQKYDLMYSVIISDIDDFKLINDKYGHDVGDEILKEFASILKNVTRKSDFLGRWGGEEFIIICSNIGKEQAAQIAQKIREEIQNNIFHRKLKLTASFGVAQCDSGVSYEELFKLADNALYKAKNGGKNRVVIA